MPIPTAVHERTFQLCTSLNYREWAGYYAPSSYETHHEHEYNAIRQAAALIDVTPLYKYHLSGRDAARLIQRMIARDIDKVAVGQVIYCCWCDEDGKVIDDGTVTRLGPSEYRWTAAEPNLRWFTQNAIGYEVEMRDISRETAALALQGPTSAKLLKKVARAELANLKYFRMTRGEIAGVQVDISRTGYTGDLGYEIWIPWQAAVTVWDAIFAAGQEFDLHAAGMLALDVVRIEAGLILLDVDYTSTRKALIDSQRYSPFEIGLDKVVQLNKPEFVGKAALTVENKRGPKRRLVGLEIDWNDVERLYDQHGLAPAVGATASRVAVPVYRGRRQIGRATSTTWSPTLKKMIALASVEAGESRIGTQLEVELTVEATRHSVGAKVVKLPFFNPARKTAVPV